MVQQTIVIHGRDGNKKILGPIGNGELAEGHKRDVLITQAVSDGSVPSHIRNEMVGLTISTVFDPEQCSRKAPEGSRVAYLVDVLDALCAAGKSEAADELRTFARQSGRIRYQLITFLPGEFQFLG
jgi:hypothetical protein